MKQALDHAANGVDVVIAQGTRRAATPGASPGWCLIPAVVDAAAPRPVLAAAAWRTAGIAAASRWAPRSVDGTRFIATHEAHGHDNYKKKIVAIDEEGTVVHRGATGKPCRAIRNEFTREWEKREGDPTVPRAGACGPRAGIRARELGDGITGTPRAGSRRADPRDRPAGEVVRRLVAETEECWPG
jgi:enoyl-[acyl-carrier protein] reductase II